MKANAQKKIETNQYSINQNNKISPIHPQTIIKDKKSIQRKNANILEKYSFQDNDHSRIHDNQLHSSNSQVNLNQPKEKDWLQLTIKEITTIGKQLITFYLLVQYEIQYKPDERSFKKKKMENQPLFEVYLKEVRSKIIHGSVLQSEGKQLVLSLKSVNPPYSETMYGKQRILRKIQLSLFRIFQTKKQGKLLAKECIEYPKNGSVYEIQFEDIDSIKGIKPKAIANMVFQIIPSIQQELDNASYDSERNSLQDQMQDQSQISEHIQGIQQTQNNLHFTLGVNKEQLVDNKNQRQKKDENIFNDDSELQEQILKNQKQELIIVSKLNDLSKMIDENLQKSKKEGAAYKNYVNQTSLMIQNWKDSEIQSNLQQNQLNSKRNANQQNPSQATQGNAHKSPKQPKKTSNIKSQATTVPKSSQNKLQYSQQQNSKHNQNDLSLLSQQRFQYSQQLSARNEKINSNQTQKNNVTNAIDNSAFAQRYDYVSRIQNTILFDQQVSNPSNQNNFAKAKKAQNQFKEKQSNQESVLPKSKQQQIRQTLKPQTNKLFSAGSQPSGHKVTQNKEFSNNTGNNATTNLQYSTSRENNQTYSRWIPKQLDDIDSSNIRYKFEENDLSNIQESKNMQELINEIDKIQKQWYQWRVLDRKNKEISNLTSKKVITNQTDKLKEDHNFDQEDKNNLMGLELKNFKVKLNQQNFYKRLFQSLKAKHNNHFRSIEKGKESEEVPKNYVVYLIAHEVDETDLKSDDPQNSGKVQIKIPSSEIDKLIQLEELQRQNNPLSPSIKSNQAHVSMSQTLEKQIIKSFQKQLRSKTMKIQILKSNKTDEDKNQNSKRKRTRMLEIAISEEYDNSNLQSQKDKILANNKINLIGMYPLPVFSDGQKDKQNSFYQNLSMEALEINMYNCQTGNQEGKICFDLRKAKQDKQIQTLQPLEDITENSNPQSHPSQFQFESQNIVSSRPSNNELLKENHVNQGTSMNRHNKIKNNNLNIQDKVNTLGKKGQALQKQQVREMKNKSRISVVNSFNSQIIPPINQFKQDVIPDNQSRSQRFISQRQSHKILEPFEQKDEFPIKKVKTQMKIPAFGEEKELSQIKNLSRSRAAKQLDLIGKILKNPTTNPNLDIKRQTKQEQLETNKKSEYELSDLRQKGMMLPLKIQKSDLHKKIVQPQKHYQQSGNNFDQKQQSYRLMKQQLMQTSNMIEVLKMKAQQFISKVDKQKKKPDLQYINSEIQFKYQGQKILPTQSLLHQNNSLAKKMISLNVRSSVINQTVLSKKKVSRNESNKPIEDLQTIEKNDIKKKISRNSQERRTQQQQQREHRSMSKNSQLKNKQRQFSIQMKQSSASPKKKHKNSSLVYKESKQYQFTQEQVDYQENFRNSKSRRKIKTDFDFRDSYHPKSKRKVFGADIDEDLSHQSIQQQQKVPKNKLKAKHQYNPIYRQNMSSPLSKNHSRSPDKNKSSLSYLREEQYIEVRLLQFRIKLLSLNHLKKITTKNSSEIDPNSSYFVLVYSDTISQNELSSNLPCVQKCSLRSQSSQNDYSVIFSKVKRGQSLKGTDYEDYLSLKGLQANKIYIQLYQSQTQQNFYRQFKSSAQSGYQTEEINLITLSPQNKKALLSQKGPLASIAVSFLELLAQRQSHQRNTDLPHRKIPFDQEQPIVHYTNFLLNNQKIVGKININYNIDFVNRNQSNENNDPIYTHNSIRKKQTSQIEVIQLKNRQKYHDVYHKQSQQNLKNQLPKKNLENFRNLRGSQPPNYRNEKSQQVLKLRSQSGMTKKLSHKKKKFQRKMMETEQTEVNGNHKLDQKQVDPLSILKRRVPKPLRRQSQSQKSRSQVFAMRIGKAYQTPLNKGKSLYESLNSSGSVPIRSNKFKNSNEKHENDQKLELSQLQESQVVLENHLNSNSNEFNEKSLYHNMGKVSKQKQSDVFQLRQKKQQKRIQKLKPYKLNSRILSQQPPQTRLGQNKKYDGGGNIKFGKSSRFIPTEEGTGQSSKSRQLKNMVPGPGYYEVKSIFDRHSIKEP